MYANEIQNVKNSRCTLMHFHKNIFYFFNLETCYLRPINPIVVQAPVRIQISVTVWFGVIQAYWATRFLEFKGTKGRVKKVDLFTIWWMVRSGRGQNPQKK